MCLFVVVCLNDPSKNTTCLGFPSKVTLTDGDGEVLKRLNKNVMENSISIPCEVGMKDTQQVTR